MQNTTTKTLWAVWLVAVTCATALTAGEIRIQVGETGLRSLT